ncbi:F-box protein At5g03100-like [Gastrolobium bilobum]|uniref:F-box protein At5g03100-like n=1 Tax=Gastrolobium bilobum TaxID=150636 RepID=UPI002AB2CE34|nr:F-box protein At5g03100-like [Gastrolobium bilobum]
MWPRGQLRNSDVGRWKWVDRGPLKGLCKISCNKLLFLPCKNYSGVAGILELPWWMMKMKRRREDRDRDNLSGFPDDVLIHIMKFISIKDAVRTCVLSKRWKDLWKDLIVLKFDNIRAFDDANFKMLEIPKYLQLPALKSLHLEYVMFTASDNDCADPFSTCKMLDTLFISSFRLHDDVKTLRISNSNLSSLTICYHLLSSPPYKIVISTPNVNSLTVMGLDISKDLVILNWLKVLANVKIMTLTSDTLSILLSDLSKSGSTSTQPPCFVRLEALKVKMQSSAKLLDEEVNRIVKYLLQNFPLARVDFIEPLPNKPRLARVGCGLSCYESVKVIIQLVYLRDASEAERLAEFVNVMSNVCQISVTLSGFE